MNKMLFTKAVRTVVSIFFILGILLQPATGNVAAQYLPSPRFDFRANVDQVEGWEWTHDKVVTLAVNLKVDGSSDYSTTGIVDWAPWDNTQTYISFNLWGFYDIQPGDEVSLSDGTITKKTTVTDLAITSFDMDADTVSGIAASGTRLDVWVCNQTNCFYRHENADVNNTWFADFGEPGGDEDENNTIDIARDTWINSQQVDEDGDRTMFGDISPNYIETHPQWDEVNARGWFRGTELAMTIRGLGNKYSATATMDQAPWNPDDPYDVIAIFPVIGFDLQSGHEITISGGGMTKTYLVAHSQVTSIDIEADTISGIATPGSKVQVCAQIPDSCISRNTEVDDSGNWIVDFSTFSDPSDTPESFDLELGSSGWMYESDDDGDQTWAYDWRVADVAIDIRPWVDPNPVLCRGAKEMIPVAVLSTPEFDATSLDPWSVHFGRTGTEAAMALFGQTDKPMKYVADVNKDGLADIVFYFRFGDTGFSCSDIPVGQHMADVEAVLSGMAGSMRVEGADVLRLVRILGH